MIPKECKRLAEVDFPIAIVSKHSARDKYIRYKPTTALHTWWAQRPLAACRAMLLALLLPDPADPHCPINFKEEARKILAPLPIALEPDDDGLRKALIKFIGDFSSWDLSSNTTYLEASRALLRACQGDDSPLVVDPFAGGWAIPLEALRLGCETFASDLNPVACLLLSVMLEQIPRHGHSLADKLRRVGTEVKNVTEKELDKYYPEDHDGARPIAYLWARTVRCESPSCGAEIPLVRSFWLCKKVKREKALGYRIIRPKGKPPEVKFEIFAPDNDKMVPGPNISRAKAKCLCCKSVLPPDRVRSQLSFQNGGVDVQFDEQGRRIGGAILLAVVMLKPGTKDRFYRLPKEHDYRAVYEAFRSFQKIGSVPMPNGLSPSPDEPTPKGGGSGAGRAFSVQKYGILNFGDLFTARQKLALITIIRAIGKKTVGKEDCTLGKLMAFVIDKFARHCNGNARWNNVIESVEPAFGSHTLPITWTFPESVVWGPWAENYDGSLEAVAQCLSRGFRGIESTA